MHSEFRRQTLFDIKLPNHNPNDLPHQSKHNSASNHPASQNFQYYSFNNCDHFFKRQSSTNRSRRDEDHPHRLQQLSYERPDNTYRSEQNSSLMQKYSSLYKQLKSVQTNQLIFLFIQEIEENQRSRNCLAEANRKIGWVEGELKVLESNLAQKRQILSKMCYTQSKNLDLIEAMERKLRDRGFVLSDHYYNKYSELEKYMSDYICSTREAQEEFMKKLTLLKDQNHKYSSENQQLRDDLFELSKLKNILEFKLSHKETTLNRQNEQEKELEAMVQGLKEENLMMKKDIEMLIENLKSYQQFQIDLNRDNREISSSLEFLRERINANCSFREADMSKANNQEVEGLRAKIQEQRKQKERLETEHANLVEAYSKLCLQLDSISKDNKSLMNIIDQNNRYMAKLKGELELSKKMEDEQMNRVIRRGASKQSLAQDSLELTNSKAKSGFITNCNSASKATLSRHTVISKYEDKQNDSNAL